MGALEGPEFYISKRVGRAIMDYKMLSDGDKIAVGVSGGKDSMALLRVLIDRKKFVPVKYDILAVHIDLGYSRQTSRMLERYFKKLGIDHHIERVDILKGKKIGDISCFWCSWNRRKALFEAADRLGCTKVALGHHKDDVIETILLNMFFHGEISAMRPKQELFGGRITIIRPFVYVEEDMIVRFSRSAGFPKEKFSCPNASVSNRARVAGIIKELKKACPDVKTNIFRSMKRIRTDYLL